MGPPKVCQLHGGRASLYARIDGPREPVRRMLEQIPGVEAVEELGPREGALSGLFPQRRGGRSAPSFMDFPATAGPFSPYRTTRCRWRKSLALTPRRKSRLANRLWEKALEEEEADLFEEDVEEKEESL